MSVLIGGKSYLQNALEINEEMQAILVPLLAKIEKEIGDDDYARLRAVHRLSMNQFNDINQLDCILDSVIETKKTCPDLNIELEPARNAIERSRVLLDNLIEIGEDNDNTTALIVISEFIIAAGQEISRVRGIN